MVDLGLGRKGPIKSEKVLNWCEIGAILVRMGGEGPFRAFQTFRGSRRMGRFAEFLSCFDMVKNRPQKEYRFPPNLLYECLLHLANNVEDSQNSIFRNPKLF